MFKVRNDFIFKVHVPHIYLIGELKIFKLRIEAFEPETFSLEFVFFLLYRINLIRNFTPLLSKLCFALTQSSYYSNIALRKRCLWTRTGHLCEKLCEK